MVKPAPPNPDQVKAWFAAAIIWVTVFAALLAEPAKSTRPELWLIAAACP